MFFFQGVHWNLKARHQSIFRVLRFECPMWKFPVVVFLHTSREEEAAEAVEGSRRWVYSEVQGSGVHSAEWNGEEAPRQRTGSEGQGWCGCQKGQSAWSCQDPVRVRSFTISTLWAISGSKGDSHRGGPLVPTRDILEPKLELGSSWQPVQGLIHLRISKLQREGFHLWNLLLAALEF